MNDLLQAQIFSGFSSWKALAYEKELTPKILRFVVTEDTGPRPFYLVSIISREEKMAWQSFQDVLEHTMKIAQNSLRGFFGFDVLWGDLREGMRNFDPKALSQLMVNHSRGLGPDQRSLIRYGQLFAILHYRAPAEWGKVEVKTHVEFFSQASASLEVTEASVRAILMGGGAKQKKSSGDQWDLFLKKFLKESAGEPQAIYLVRDLSVQPLWDPANELQQQRVRVWFEKETASRGGNSPEIYYGHAGKCSRVQGG